MKHFLIFLLLLPAALFGQIQKRFSAVVEFSNFTTVNDSTFRGDLINWSDPLSEGYLPSQIQAGFRAVDAAGRMYRVAVLNSSTFSSANVDLVELQDNNQAPIGAGTIYQGTANLNLIPSAVANALGVTPVTRSRTDISNFVVLDEIIQGILDSLANAGGGAALNKSTLTAGNTTMFIRWFGTNPPTLTSGAAGVFTLSFPAGTVPKGFRWDGNNTSVDGSGDVALTISDTDGENLFFTSNVINRGNNQVSDLPTLGVNIEQANPSAGQVVGTFTSMNGFGASGFRILARFE